MCLIHRAYYKSLSMVERVKEDLELSPIIMKLEMKNNNPAYKYRSLMGTGFYFNSDIFMDNMPIFYAICVMLDYLSLKFSKSEEMQAELEGIDSLYEYSSSAKVAGGTYLIAGARNAGDLGLTSLKSADGLDAFNDCFTDVTVNESASGAKQIVKSSWNEIANNLKTRRGDV